jgi:hypothetical protein
MVFSSLESGPAELAFARWDKALPTGLRNRQVFEEKLPEVDRKFFCNAHAYQYIIM